MSGVEGPPVVGSQPFGSNTAQLRSAGLGPVSVSAIGDSITATCNNNQDLGGVAGVTGGNPPYTYAQLATFYETIKRTHYLSSWLLHGAMRSRNSWFANQFVYGYGGQGGAIISTKNLAVLLGNPYGLPDMCAVLMGTNDGPTGTNITPAAAMSYVRTVIVSLLAAGVTPIVCTLLPRADSSTYSKFIDKCNNILVRLAREFNCPLADFHSALSDGAGNWAYPNSAGAGVRHTTDGVHPTPLGSSVMGKVINDTIQAWIRPQSRLVLPIGFDDSAVAYKNRNPNLTAITGTVNTPSSYPSTGWFGGGPNHPALNMMVNTDISEPGIGRTQRRSIPSHDAVSPIYQGNTWVRSGDGVTSTNTNESGIVVAAGDKIVFSFRLKTLVVPAAASPFSSYFFLVGTPAGSQFGGFLTTPSGAVDPVQIGGEASYEAADFYSEVDLPVGSAGFINITTYHQNFAGASNVGDIMCIANPQYVNLTAAGWVSP